MWPEVCARDKKCGPNTYLKIMTASLCLSCLTRPKNPTQPEKEKKRMDGRPKELILAFSLPSSEKSCKKHRNKELLLLLIIQ